MIKASEIMNTQVFSVKADTTIEEAVKILAGNNISGLPVVDDDNRIIGVVSEKDILEFSSDLHIIPLISSSTWVSPHTDVADISIARKGYEMMAQEKVRNVMTKKVISITKDTSWAEIFRLMKKNRINRLPVVDDDRTLCGIITRSDLLNYLAEHHVVE